MGARVSAVMPCKNRPVLRERALESIAAQTVRPDEVVVVDDGSEPPIVVSRSYPIPVKLIRQENRGPAAARNRGVREASGDWIAFLDSDDTWVPEKTEYQLRLLSQYPTAGFCISNMTTHGRPTVEFPLAPAHGVTDGIIDDAIERLLPGRFISTSGVVFRRDLFHQVGGFDESLWYCEDYDLWVRLAAITPVVVTTRSLNDVFREGDNLSDFEDDPAAGEVIAAIFRKLMVWPLFDAHIRPEAGFILGKKLFDLAYTYRKSGRPLAAGWATLRSLANSGPVTANLKNLLYCWPELILQRFASWNAARE
jgi:glycosyltransferase involved in cell wall biosynthesis